MRDNHKGLLEVIRSFEKDGHFFAIIEIEKGGRSKKFQIGVSKRAYLALQRILQYRPFDMMPGLKYRYFYVRSSRKIGVSKYEVGIRIECERDAKNVDFEIPQDLHANLLWFDLLKSFDEQEELLKNLEVL